MAETTRTIVYEEESFAVHSGLVFRSTIGSLHKVEKVLDKMGLIEFESDLLQKKDSHVSLAWEIYKNSAISKLKAKLFHVTQILNNIINTTADVTNGSEKDKEIDMSDSNEIRPKLVKRSIEFLGNLISYVTGVPGPKEWRLNQANIGHLKKALLLVNRKERIQEQRITNVDHRLSTVSTKVESLLQTMSITLSEMSTIEHDFKATLIFGTLENGVMQLLEEMQYLVSGIDNILFKGHFQLASSYGIDKEFLRKAIIDIQSKHKTLVPIFSTNEIEKYYETPLTTVTLHGEEIWSTIKIPMVNYNDRFEKIVETGKLHDNFTELESLGVKSVEWFADKQDRNIFVSKSKIAHCIQYRSTAICEGRKAVIRSRFVDTGNVIDNFWGETENTGFFAFLNKDNVTTQIDCAGDKHTLVLGTRGILYLHDTCTLKSENVRINRVNYYEGMRVRKIEHFHLRDLSNIEIKSILTDNRMDKMSTTTTESTTRQTDEVTTIITDEFDNEISQIDERFTSEDKIFYGGIFTSSSAVLLLICGVITTCWLINRNRAREANTTVNIAKEVVESNKGNNRSNKEKVESRSKDIESPEIDIDITEEPGTKSNRGLNETSDFSNRYK